MSAYSAALLATSPTIYLRLGDASGLTAVDSSGNNVTASYRNDGSGHLYGVTLGQSPLIAGDSNTSALFDGTNGLVSIAAVSQDTFTGDVGLGMIVNMPAFPTSGNIWCLGGQGSASPTNTEGYRLFLLNSSGTLQLIWGRYDQAANTNYQATWNIVGWNVGETHHIVCIYASGAWQIFFDGSLAASFSTANGAVPSTQEFFLAAEGDYNGSSNLLNRFANAKIQDVAVWGATPPTASQIAALYAVAVPNDGSLSVVGNPGPNVTLQSPTFSYGTAPYSTQLQRATTSGGTYTNVGVAKVGNAPLLTDNTATVGATYYYRAQTTDHANAVEFTTSLPVYVWNSIQSMQVSRRKGIFFHFNTATFTSSDTVDAIDVTNIFGNQTPGGSFTPMVLNIDNWISAAKSAGATFALLTASHGDGFRLWPSASSPRNITTTTWYASNPIDICGQFVSKCRAAGISPGFYYSVYDRYQQENASTYPSLPNYVTAALTELMVYNPDVMYVDNNGNGIPYTTLSYATVQSAIKAGNPNCCILVNNQNFNLAYTDVIEYERPANPGGDVPSGNIQPCNETLTIQTDVDYFDHANSPALYSASFLNSLTTQVNSRNASILINCPPSRTGSMPAATTTLMQQLGNGASSADAAYIVQGKIVAGQTGTFVPNVITLWQKP